MRLIDADALKLPQGFFETVDNVPKFFEWLNEQQIVDAVPWMWLEVFAKTKPFDSVEAFIAEAKEMNRKMYSCCCFDGERKENENET